MAPTFQGLLGCVKIKIFAGVMLESASNLEGIHCFFPVHCLSVSKRNNVERIITAGLSIIMKRAETRSWNGKKKISAKTQDLIDPLLASFYNIFSLSAGLTDPYQDCSLPMPETVIFKIDAAYIPEGENDNCKLEILLHDDIEIVMFLWKEFKKYGTYVFLRHTKTTWALNATNGNLFTVNYEINGNKMVTTSGELEKIVGWPKERKNALQMFEEAKLKLDCKLKQLNNKTYKWIKSVPMQYLYGMQIDLDEPNEDGITLLHILAELNETKNMKCLIDKLKNIDPRDCLGQTPLHRACAKSNFKTAKILIEHGANVNAITNENDSPLTILASQNEKDISLMKILLEQNANREHENKDCMRAVDLVRQSKAKDKVIRLLRPT